MDHRSPLIAPLLLCAAGSLSAQLQTGSWTALPAPAGPAGLTFSTADHSKIVFNERGDLFATWDVNVQFGNLIGSGVVGAFLQRTGPTTWDIPSAAVLLGDPSPLYFGMPWIDLCNHSDVVAIGNDFYVSWARVGTLSGSPDLARVELAVIDVDPGGAATLLVPASTPGAGYVIDPVVEPGEEGLGVDLVALANPASPGTPFVGAAYPSETSPADPDGDNKHEVRLALAQVAQLPPSVTLSILVESVDFDYLPGSPMGLPGDKILPDVITDASGNLVLAYEAFDNADASGAVDLGQIRVQRFEIDWGSMIAAPLRGEPALVLHQGSFQHLQRRPGLFRREGEDAVQIAWVTTDPLGDPSLYTRIAFGASVSLPPGGPKKGRVQLQEIDFVGPATTLLGPVPWFAVEDDRRPVPISYRDASGALHKLLFFDREDYDGVSLREFDSNGWIREPSPSLSGKRVAADAFETPGAETLVVLTQEGGGQIQVLVRTL